MQARARFSLSGSTKNCTGILVPSMHVNVSSSSTYGPMLSATQ